MKLSQIATALQGELNGADREVAGFSTDTRAIAGGELFIALIGERFDAHDFVGQAAANGAAAALVSRPVAVDLPQIVVADTHSALGQLGQLWCQQFPALRRVAMTGSAGKTTVKELTASILAQLGTTLATKGNLNNDIGVPLTLLSLRPEHAYGVFELGANHLGEIAYTSALVQPEAAVVTNVGTAHLEGFGSREGIARAKAEIYGGLTANGVAVINLDDDFADEFRAACADRRVLTCSLSRAEADIRATEIARGTAGCYRFRLHLLNDSRPVQLRLLGEHNVANALAAAALAHAVGADIDKIKEGLEQTQPVKGRLVSQEPRQGLLVIDDTYNANPASMKAAIDVLADMPGRRIYVCGDMAELGEASENAHREVGEWARMKKVDALYAVGQYALFTAEGYGERARVFANKQQLLQDLEQELNGVVTILVKGSRSARMEEVVDSITRSQETD